VKGEARPVWRDHLKVIGDLKEDLADPTTRKEMPARLASLLDALELPYFLPKEKKYVALPAIVE
jgi:hypothetical protein